VSSDSHSKVRWKVNNSPPSFPPLGGGKDGERGKGGGNELKVAYPRNIKKYAKSRVDFFVIPKVK
jgi:hypothetical protein